MCWDCNNNKGGDPYKNYRRGGVDPEDFEKEVNYRPKKKTPKPKKKHFGCPKNDGKAHVYVWTTEFEETGMYSPWWMTERVPSFYKEHGFHQYERLICVGCGQQKKMRYTEEFNKWRTKRRKKNTNLTFYGW